LTTRIAFLYGICKRHAVGQQAKNVAENTTTKPESLITLAAILLFYPLLFAVIPLFSVAAFLEKRQAFQLGTIDPLRDSAASSQ
jgi:hypothetical protein